MMFDPITKDGILRGFVKITTEKFICFYFQCSEYIYRKDARRAVDSVTILE